MTNDEVYILRVIEAVQKRPAVFNPNHPDHKNPVLKTMLWDEIAKELGYDQRAVKSKWRNLRDAYRKYWKWRRTRLPKYAKYKSWPWGQLMSFMEDTLEPTNEMTLNIDFVGGGSTYNGKKPAETDNQDNDEIDNREPEFNESDSETNAETQNAEVPIKRGRKRRITAKIIKQEPRGSSMNSGSPEAMDAVDHLFHSYAKTFKNFSKYRQTHLKVEIAKMFAQAEMEEIQNDPLSTSNVKLDFKT